jgi:hypothetical protein
MTQLIPERQFSTQIRKLIFYRKQLGHFILDFLLWEERRRFEI